MIVESLRDGGKQRRLVELLRVLSEEGKHRVLVLFLKNDVHFNEIFDFQGIEFCFLKRKFRTDPRVFFSFINRARRFSPDLVHSWGGLPAVVALPYILLSSKPFVNGMIANSRLKFLSKEWFRTKCTFPFSDVIISNSQIGLKVYKVPDAKARLIRNGINFDRLENLATPQEIMAGYGFSSIPKIVGMVATIDYRKNFSMFIEAALQLISSRDDVVFFIVGDGPGKDKIQAMIPEDKKNHFVFTGKINNVEEVVASFDVGVLASYGEGTSNSLLEYMLLEKPVVATDVFGINEVVRNGVDGYLVPQNDYKAMALKISELLDNAGLAQKMGKSGKQRVARDYSIHQMVSSYESVYREVIKK